MPKSSYLNLPPPLSSVKGKSSQDAGQLNRWSIDVALDAAVPATVHGEATPALAIPDSNPTGITSSIALTRAGSVRSLKVSVDVTHTYIGDLRIQLEAPSGRSVVLHAQLGAGQDNLVVTYDSAANLSPLSGLVGQAIQGSWTLRVADLAAVDVGKLNKWSIDIVAA